jgi:hypothetical protein
MPKKALPIGGWLKRHPSEHAVSTNLSFRITLEIVVQEVRIIWLNVGDQGVVY